MIQVTDNRIEQKIYVARENIEISVSLAAPQTFQTMDEDGSVREVTLNIVQPPKVTTLKDIEADISNVSSNISAIEGSLTSLRDRLSTLISLRADATDKIDVAISPDLVAPDVEKQIDGPTDELVVDTPE